MSRRSHKSGLSSTPQPRHTETAEQRRSVSGDVHVRGEVTIETSQEEAHARKTETEKRDARDTKRWRLEILSFFVLSCYAALTFWQGCSSQKSANAAKSAADTAKQALDSTNRSWLEMRLAPVWDEDSTDIASAQRVLQNLTQIVVPLELTNIGHVPVRNIHADTDVELLDRDQTTHLDYGGRHGTLDGSILYPTRTLHFEAVLYSPGQPPPDRDVPPINLSPPLRNELQNGQKYIVVYARGTFVDDLGEHWFHFCRWLPFADPKSRLGYNSGACVAYNNAGDFPIKRAR